MTVRSAPTRSCVRARHGIRLGAGVVALPFEHPVRIAEDAAVTDQLAGGRLELGVGKGLRFGLSAAVFAVFGVPPAERDSRYRSHLAALQEILGSVRVGSSAALYPPPGTLRRRIWQSTGSIGSACAAAAAGYCRTAIRSPAGRAASPNWWTPTCRRGAGWP